MAVIGARDPPIRDLWRPSPSGGITKAAFLAAAPAKFKAADKNGDGVLDAAELNASMKPS